MSGDREERASSPAGPESQSQRWAKYGSNVALMIVLAIVVAGLITYIAQAHDLRLDTTAAGINSLKPQTLNILRDLKTDIRLISLYSPTEQSGAITPAGQRPVDRAAMVSDLLDNYQRASSRISVQTIDPSDNAKVVALQADLDARYGGKDIRNYKTYLNDYQSAYRELTQLLSAQVDRIAPIVLSQPNDEIAPQIRDGLNNMRRWLDNNDQDLKRHLQEHRPDFRGITGTLRTTLQQVSDSEKNMIGFFQKNRDNAKVSAPVRKYMADNLASHEKIQKLADDQIARIDKLGDLKVDELQQALDVPNPVLVLGPTDWRVLSETQLWPTSTVHGDAGEKVIPDFAGEQQITSAILALTSPTKPKVVFLRPGGGPLTTPGIPLLQPGGPLSDLAERLREYNFDVLEKDMSGTYAMQAQMQGGAAPPEPSWDDIKDAVWIVLDIGRPINGTESVGTLLAEHLGHGGSAVVLWNPPGPTGPESGPTGPDSFQTTLATWGVDIHPDMLAVHAEPPAGPTAGADPFQDFLRRPYVWDIRDYGDAELAQPLRNLESLLVLVGVSTTRDVNGYTIHHLLPLPTAPAAPAAWAQKNYQDVLTGNPPKFDAATDLSPPLFGGAAVEKKGGGRLVVIGCIQFVINDLLEFRDEAIYHSEGRSVARFPGNGELAMNSVFWCAKMDSMIALSPAALQVSRIAAMSDGVLGFWRVGVLLVLLPVLVLAAGAAMYFNRRD